MRSEEKEIEITEGYLDNAKSILHFCLHLGIEESLCLGFSKLPIDYADFVGYYEYYKGDLDKLKGFIVYRLNKIERNRIETINFGTYHVDS